MDQYAMNVDGFSGWPTHIERADADVVDCMRRMNGRYGEEMQIQPSTVNNLQMYPQRYAVNKNANSEGTTEKDMLAKFTVSPMLPVSSSLMAYISHIENGPFSFYVQLKPSAEDALPRLSMLLMKEEAVLYNRPMIIGTPVMTRVSPGNCFKRSVVKEFSQNSCLVYHVDYGNTEEISFSEIYELPILATHAPAMAVRFSMANLKSIQITDAMKAYFQDFLLGKPVLVTITPQESGSPLYQYCELYYEGRNVKDILIAFNSPLEYTSQHPPRGKDIKVIVSHIHSPSLFFIQYNNKVDIVNKIQEAVQAYCKTQSPLQDLKSVSISSPVAALFEDNIWYRGLVVGLKDNQAQILYVDYGNRLEVPANCLCPISRELVTQWRSQAVECCLQGFENDNANEVNLQVLEAMEEILNQHYNMTPLQILPGNRYVVELVDEHGGKLSNKLQMIKLSGSAAPGLQSRISTVVPNQDISSTTENQETPVKARNNFYVRPSIRPLVENKNKYSEHDDRTNDTTPESFNRQSSFERTPRFPRNDDTSRRNRDSFDEHKSNNRFSNASEGKSFGNSETNNFGGGRNFFPRPPINDSYNKPSLHKGPPSVDEDSSNHSSKGGQFDRSSETPKQSLSRGVPKKPWENEGSDVASDSVDDQKNWSPGGKGSWNSDRTKPGKRPGERPDMNKWGGENERPKRDGGNRFNDRRSDSGDFGGNKNDDDGNRFSRNRDDSDTSSGRFGNRNRNDGESGGGNRFGNRNREDGESGGNRFGHRNRDDGESGGNRFGNRNRDDGESGGNRFGNRKRDDGESGGNRFGNRSRDEESGGNRFGNRNRDEESGGNRFGNRNRDEESGGNRFGNRNRDEESGVNRFGNRKRDDGEGGGNRFGNKNRDEGGDTRFGGRKRDDGEGGGNRFGGRKREDGEGGGNRFGGDRRRDGRFNDSQGRRDGGRFNKDNDFKGKRFDSDSFSSPKPGHNSSNVADESWDDQPAVQTIPTPKSAIIRGYPAQNVSTTTEMQVMVSSVVNPQFFYVQEVGCEAALDLMRSTIDNLSENLQPVNKDCLSPGSPVLARFSEDSLLYRGTVKYLLPPDQAHILFVDYGNLESVNLTELFSIPVELLSTPPLSLHCSLHDVSPPNQGWPGSYEGFMDGDEVFTMKILSVKMIDGEVQVSAKLVYPDGVLLSKKLSDAGLAVTIESTSIPQMPHIADEIKHSLPEEAGLPNTTSIETVVMPEDKWISPMSILLGQYLYGEVLESVEERSFVIRLLDAKVVTLAILADHQASSCIQPLSNVIIHVDEILEDRLRVSLFDLNGVEKGPLTDVTREHMKISPVCAFPVVRAVEIACISHVEGTEIYIHRSSDIDNISKMIEEAFTFYNESEVEDIEWSIGDLCCAKSVLDENWYRAKIESTNITYTVRYLDYGNTEILPKENLRKLDQKFIFAEFSLKVTLPVKWITLETDLLDILPIEDKVVCKLISKNGLWIADVTCASGKRLADILKENKIAEETIDNPFDENNLPIDFDLTVGAKMPIVVSHADSPSMFWAHTLGHTYRVDELQEKLQVAIETAADATESDKVFAAQYSADNVWYRATKVDDEILRFIDYGNTDALVSPKKLPDDMIQPASGYAIPMYLCVKPLGEDWSVDAIKEFEIFIEQQNIVADIINVDFKIVVDLCEGQKSLSKILIESGEAVYFDYIPELVKNHSETAVPDYFTQKIKEVKSTPSHKNQVELLNQYSSEKIVTSQNIPSESIVFVSHCDTLNDFYVQEQSKTARIDTIQSNMINLENAEIASDIKVGGLYGVKFEDELWYRAKVLSIESEIKVIFVDYGNTFVANDFRILSEDLISEEPMAIHCSLGVDETPEAYSKFVKLTVEEQTPLLLTVLSCGNPYIVQLQIDGMDILTHIGLSPNTTNIQKGKQKVFITHVYGPDCFYVQTEKQLSMLEELSVQMSAGESFGPLDRIQVGDIIAVLFEDDSYWYRGEVLSFAPEVLVRFVDYGNSSIVKEYRELPPEMKGIEFLVTRCSLKLPADKTSWPEKIGEVFATTCAMNPEDFEMEVLSTTQGNTIVELYLNGEAITETLVNTSTAIDGKADDSAAIEEPLQENSTSSKPQKGRAERGYVTHINSVYDFYIQKEDCADLLRHVADSLSALKDNENGKPDCGLGSLIAAKLVDGEWYRGEILQIDPEIRVRFIDYGNECNVSEISALPEELKQIPPVAMKCSLDLAGKPLKDDAKEVFHKHFGGAESVFEFIIKSMSDGVNIVEIILDNINVSSMLCLGTNVDQDKSEAEANATQDSAIDDASSELIGKVIKGYISHINSVKDFYIQEESSTETLQIILLGLDDSCSVENAPATCDVGDLIGAKFTDGHWYRGEVTSTSPELKTRFIDYGNESVVSEISSLTQHLLELPSVALRCSLDLENLSDCNGINQEFMNLFGDGATLLDFHIVSSHKGLNVVKALLGGEDICLKLKEAEPCINSIDKSKEHVVVECVENTTESTNDHISHENFNLMLECLVEQEVLSSQETIQSANHNASQELDMQDGQQAADIKDDQQRLDIKYSKQEADINDDKHGVDIQYDKQEADLKDANQEAVIHNTNQDANIDGANEDVIIKDANQEFVIDSANQENVMEDANKEVVIPNNHEFTTPDTITAETNDNIESQAPVVIPVGSENQNDCNINSETVLSEGFNLNDVETDNSETSHIIVSTVNSLTDFYLNVKSEEFKMLNKILMEAELFDDPSGVCEGDILAGKSIEDGQWYRCKVEEILDGNYSVFLIDFGRRTNVSQFKELPNELILLEPLAIHCSLYCPEGCWPNELTNVFRELCNNVYNYEIINKRVSPISVKLYTDKGDMSTILSEHILNGVNVTADGHDPLQKTEKNAPSYPSEKSNENPTLLKICKPLESKEEPSLKEDKNSVSEGITACDKKPERKSLPSKPVKSLAEIKANAKARIVTRSQGSSPVDKKLTKNEVRSPSEPRIDEIHVNDRLQRPLFVRTSSLDDTPVPGSMSNPSSPLGQVSKVSKSSPSESTSSISPLQSSPRHSVAEKILPGSISGVIVDESAD